MVGMYLLKIMSSTKDKDKHFPLIRHIPDTAFQQPLKDKLSQLYMQEKEIIKACKTHCVVFQVLVVITS